MGCQLTVSQRDPDKDSETPARTPEGTTDLLSLPDEVLVRIISFLPETRDRVKLRYVSRELRSISETPSLWREFVWPDCNRREEKCLHNVMKACGGHIRRLSFPRNLLGPGALPTVSQTTLKSVKMSEMVKMLQYCSNLTHLNLQALGDFNSHDDDWDKQLRKGIEEMKYLEVLIIYCHGSFQPYLNLKIKLKELTIYTVIHSRRSIEASQNWMTNGFTPPNLNIVILTGSIYPALARFRQFLMPLWPSWNAQIPAGRVACLKLYIGYKAPLNLFRYAPVFQLQYGGAVTLPFVQASDENDLGKWLLLTEDDDGGKMGKFFMQPSYEMYRLMRDHGRGNQLQLDDNLTDLTELDFTEGNIDFKQIVVTCPQLQRLNLARNRNLRLIDLQVIAASCCKLQGLNLIGIPVADINFCVKAWELLSSMKLTYLSIDTSFVESLMDDTHKALLIALFKQFTTLQALEIDSRFVDLDTKSTTSSDYKILSHFPSLKFCKVSSSIQSTCAQDILTTCEKLKYFYCKSLVQLSLSSVYNNNLQQLCISSQDTDLDDNFMNTVSAHGGLVHVALFVHSVTSNGVSTLIKNSPNLLSFGLQENRYEENYVESQSVLLHKKFASRKLFTSGIFSLIKRIKDRIIYDHEYVEYDDWLQNTDLLSLWPPNLFADLKLLTVYFH